MNFLSNVLNLPGSRQKGVRNKRFKSIVERKCDEVKQRKSKKLSKNDVGSSIAPSQVTFCMSIRVVKVHMYECAYHYIVSYAYV